MYAELAGMALSLQPGEAFYIPLKTGKGPEGGAPWRDHALKELSPVLRSEKILKHGHDLKNILIVLARLGIRLRGTGCDTMVGSYLLNPSRKSHDITEAAREFLDRELIPAKEILGSGAKALSPADVDPERMKEYAGQRAEASLRLCPILTEKIREVGLKDLYEQVEMPLVEVLAAMEQKGVLIDLKLLKEMSGQFDHLLAQSERGSTHLRASASTSTRPSSCRSSSSTGSSSPRDEKRRKDIPPTWRSSRRLPRRTNFPRRSWHFGASRSSSRPTSMPSRPWCTRRRDGSTPPTTRP
jgi:DNA polymerase I-like protein with 3'-5' exonuclease and polymerase domains